jgi:hypothetical protein
MFGSAERADGRGALDQPHTHLILASGLVPIGLAKQGKTVTKRF